MQIDPREQDPRRLYHLMTSCVCPRPIAWVSTVSRSGVRNLAPFSYFSGITSTPPLLSISVGRRRGKRKDTADNASSVRQFVVNVVSEACIDQMVASSGEYAPEVDEFEKAGVTAVESVMVKPPRVAEAPIQMECITRQIIEISPGIVDLVIGEVVMFHVSDALALDDELRLDPSSWQPLARLGGDEYAGLGPIMKRDRPKV